MNNNKLIGRGDSQREHDRKQFSNIASAEQCFANRLQLVIESLKGPHFYQFVRGCIRISMTKQRLTDDERLLEL
jgi:hypothetical protein